MIDTRAGTCHNRRIKQEFSPQRYCSPTMWSEAPDAEDFELSKIKDGSTEVDN